MDATNPRGTRILVALVGFYLLIVIPQSLLKLVWADELFTYYIARQPGMGGVWRALGAGADPNPPLMHVLVKLSTAAFGGSGLAMRVPAIACVLLAMMAMWTMLRRWVTPLFAAAGVLAFMATRGLDYAYDARSYAPMMGFGMAALALWMWANDLYGWARRAALGGMALALAAGISSNYYCVLAFFPIAAGEVVRLYGGVRLRWDVWVAMVVGAVPLVAYLPLIRHNIAEFGPHAWNRPHLSMVGWSYLELVEGVFWPVLGLAIYAVWRRRGGRMMPWSEGVAVGTLIVYPMLGYAIAVGGAGMISPRCVAPVCCGFGLAAGILGQKVFGSGRRGGMVMALVFVMWVGAREWVCANLLLEQRESFLVLCGQVAASGARRVDSADTTFPLQHYQFGSGTGEILVADSSFVMPLYFYSGEDVRRQIVFPIDFEAIHRLQADDSGEQNLWAGRDGVFPFPVVSFQSVGLDRGTTVVAAPDGWLVRSIWGRGILLGADSIDTGEWSRVGGVFTPMAHPETRILHSPR